MQTHAGLLASLLPALVTSEHRSIDVLARHRQVHMAKLIHCNQTGFIKLRLASGNLRRLLHFTKRALSLKTPTNILSLHAVKTFDRLEWSYLRAVLEVMGFGIAFVELIKVLYDNPSAMIITCQNCSPPFPIIRGLLQVLHLFFLLMPGV